MGTNISGFTSPHTSLTSAFSHSTLSGVGGLNCSPRWLCIAIRTRSSSFSILRPAFSAPIHENAATAPSTVLRRKNAAQDTPWPVATRNHASAQPAETAAAAVRRMLFALEMSTASTGGGNCCRQMLPTSATMGAGYFASCLAGSVVRFSAGPAFFPCGSSDSLSSTPFSRNSARAHEAR